MPDSKPADGDHATHGWTLDTAVAHLSGAITAVEKYFTDLSAEREARTAERFSAAKEAVNAALAAAEKAIAAAMTASEKAILKAEAAAEKRAEASNEIRAAMIDQQRNFADKIQTDFRLAAIEKRLDGVDVQFSAAGGRASGLGSSAGFLFQVIASLASLAAIGLLVVTLLRH